ncbi:hypothetical protein [Maribacter sp.]|uniref:hypothetical protein n=1 Tax=Maribacter sp. TaxID=1897614 RepID=UPI0025B8E1ED|nr:hypothetical protein [Maribacter sp.]
MILKFNSYRIAKQKLLRKFPSMGKKEFANLINPIMAEKRGVPIDTVKHVQFIRSNEVIAFLEKIGEPLEGYGKLIVINTQGTDKKTLRTRLSVVCQPEFVQMINTIISENRNMLRARSLQKKYLHPKEVVTFLTQIGEVY